MTVKHTPDKMDARVAKTRETVLGVGTQILFREGWAALTHARVAQETKIARGTLYRHWPTTEKLIRDIFETCDPSDYVEARGGNIREDLINQLSALQGHLATSKLSDIIRYTELNAAINTDIDRIHVLMHEIIAQPVLDILEEAEQVADAEITSDILVGTVLYTAMSRSDRAPLNVEHLVDWVLSK